MQLGRLHLFNLLIEDVESKLPHLVKILTSAKSKWPGKDQQDPEGAAEYVRSLVVWDPSGDRGTYLPFIIKQLAVGNASIQGDDGDGPQLREALEKFEASKNSKAWPLPKDINQIDDWHKIAEVEGDFKTKRSARREASAGAETVFQLTVPMKDGDQVTFKVLKITEPETAYRYGMGTKWCTTMLFHPELDSQVYVYPKWHEKAGQQREMPRIEGSKTESQDDDARAGFPDHAIEYLKYGPLWIIFRNTASGAVGLREGGSGQIFQLTMKGGGELRGPDDRTPPRCSQALDYVLGSWAAADDTAPKPLIASVRQRCLKVDERGNICPDNYEGRPPL